MGDEMDDLLLVLNSGSSSIKFSAVAEGADHQTQSLLRCWRSPWRQTEM